MLQAQPLFKRSHGNHGLNESRHMVVPLPTTIRQTGEGGGLLQESRRQCAAGITDIKHFLSRNSTIFISACFLLLLMFKLLMIFLRVRFFSSKMLQMTVWATFCGVITNKQILHLIQVIVLQKITLKYEFLCQHFIPILIQIRNCNLSVSFFSNPYLPKKILFQNKMLITNSNTKHNVLIFSNRYPLS